jgi:hypothetical protein
LSYLEKDQEGSNFSSSLNQNISEARLPTLVCLSKENHPLLVFTTLQAFLILLSILREESKEHHRLSTGHLEQESLHQPQPSGKSRPDQESSAGKDILPLNSF